MANHKYNYFSEHIIEEKLSAFQTDVHPLWGIQNSDDRRHFAKLISEAIKEIRFISKLSDTIHLQQIQTIPDNENFDPYVIAIQHYHKGNTDEACWLLFLTSYIGKHPKSKWSLLYNIYNFNGDENTWNWKRTNQSIDEFKNWLIENEPWLKKSGGLGNVHKFSVFDYNKAISTGNDIADYVQWVKSMNNHFGLFCTAVDACQGQSNNTFYYLYNSLNENTGFNKLIKFNYLALIGNCGIVNIKPEHLYLNDILLHKQAVRNLIKGKRRIKISVKVMNKLMMILTYYLEPPQNVQILKKALLNRFKEKSIGNRHNFRRADKV